MKFLKNNKGVILFYLMITVFTLVLLENAKVRASNDNNFAMLQESITINR